MVFLLPFFFKLPTQCVKWQTQQCDELTIEPSQEKRRTSLTLSWPPWLFNSSIHTSPVSRMLTCSTDGAGKNQLFMKSMQYLWEKTSREILTTAFLVFCLMGLSLDAQSGGTTSRRLLFFSKAGFSSLLWGGGNSTPGLSSRYASPFWRCDGCVWSGGSAPRPAGASAQEPWTPAGPLVPWKLPLLLSTGFCPEPADRFTDVYVFISSRSSQHTSVLI